MNPAKGIKTDAAFGGHYWCPRCDDVAFGKHCQRCHNAAEFIPDNGLTKRKETPVTPERAHELFKELWWKQQTT
jgi:hypothetical protein